MTRAVHAGGRTAAGVGGAVTRARASLRRRLDFVRHARVLPLAERLLRSVVPGGMDPRAVLEPRLRTAADGAPFFDVGGTEVFFLDSEVPEEGWAEAVRGAVHVLTETLLREPAFFGPQVGIHPGDHVFDLGGHIGTSALLFSDRVGPRGRVYSFEPVFVEPFRRTMQANGVENVVLVPAAVGDRVGEAHFAVTDFGLDSRMDPGGSGGRRRTVPITTVDAYRERHGPDRVGFIKLDVEGAEERALLGARRTLEECRPRLSIASDHRDRGFGGEFQRLKLVRFLRGLGYRLRERGGRRILAW